MSPLFHIPTRFQQAESLGARREIESRHIDGTATVDRLGSHLRSSRAIKSDRTQVVSKYSASTIIWGTVTLHPSQNAKTGLHCLRRRGNRPMRGISRTNRKRFLAGAGGLSALTCVFFGSELNAHQTAPAAQPQTGALLANPPGSIEISPVPAPGPLSPPPAAPPIPDPAFAPPPSASPMLGIPTAPPAPVANALLARTQAADNGWVQVRVTAPGGGVSSFHMVRQSLCHRRGRWEGDDNGCTNWLRRTGAFGPKPVDSRYWLEVDVIYYLVPVCAGTLTWRANALVQGSRDQMEVRLGCPTR